MVLIPAVGRQLTTLGLSQASDCGRLKGTLAQKMVHDSALSRTSVLALVLALILFADTVQSASPRRGTNSSVLMSKLLETYCQTCPPPEGSHVQVQLALLNIPEVSTDKAFIQVHGWWDIRFSIWGITARSPTMPSLSSSPCEW